MGNTSSGGMGGYQPVGEAFVPPEGGPRMGGQYGGFMTGKQLAPVSSGETMGINNPGVAGPYGGFMAGQQYDPSAPIAFGGGKAAALSQPVPYAAPITGPVWGNGGMK